MEQDVGALDVGEPGPLGQGPGAVQELDRLTDLPDPSTGLRLARQQADLELGKTGGENGRPHLLELLHRLRLAVPLGQRLGPGERGLDATALVGGDTVREEVGVDAEPFREPLDRLARGARLAPLDLADVLLREARAGELRLRQARGDPQLAQALT